MAKITKIKWASSESLLQRVSVHMDAYISLNIFKINVPSRKNTSKEIPDSSDYWCTRPYLIIINKNSNIILSEK